jgi:hypothetical protein
MSTPFAVHALTIVPTVSDGSSSFTGIFLDKRKFPHFMYLHEGISIIDSNIGKRSTFAIISLEITGDANEEIMHLAGEVFQSYLIDPNDHRYTWTMFQYSDRKIVAIISYSDWHGLSAVKTKAEMDSIGKKIACRFIGEVRNKKLSNIQAWPRAIQPNANSILQGALIKSSVSIESEL